jgi:predicted RNase H-like nuclease (RuvC/YqgF family)
MVELGEPLPRSSRPLVFHSVVHFDTAVLVYIQDQIDKLNEEVESLRETTSEQEGRLEEMTEQIRTLTQTTSEQQVQLENTNEEVEGLRKIVSEQRDEFEGMNEQIESLHQTTSELLIQLEDTNEEIEALREVVSEQEDQLDEINEEVKTLRQTTSEQQDQRDTAAVSHETQILRTAMEQMEMDLGKIAIITGIVAGMVTAAFRAFFSSVGLIYRQIMMVDGAWDVAMMQRIYERCFVLFWD